MASQDPEHDNIQDVPENQTTQPSAMSMKASAILSRAQGLVQDEMARCSCKKFDKVMKGQRMSAEELERILNQKELELRTEYDKILERERALMKDRFDFIIKNEQIRASCMLREAHRERQEKITALQSQLQCKNLAALMYVMCTEKRRSRLEKLRIIEEYSNYIHVLQEILAEGQELILHLSRGYKTAARVDFEWREKMKKVVGEFLSFIYHFAGGNPETNQYLIDLPKLLKTEASIVDDPDEDPCEDEEDNESDQPVTEIPRKKQWWEQLDEHRRPFVMFGDLCDFKPPERREVFKSLKAAKAAKTAPKKWKHYAFKDMFLHATCKNLDKIKDKYLERLPIPTKWECIPTASETKEQLKNGSKVSLSTTATEKRLNGQSVDIRGNMGSILKIITSTCAAPVSAKTELLGARDSMEITSTTKLRERASLKPPEDAHVDGKVVIAIGRRRTSVFAELEPSKLEPKKEEEKPKPPPVEEPEPDPDDVSALGSIHNDSLEVIPAHVPEKDHRINYERVCPMEKCQRMQVDSFMRSLPPYMRANPFTHFEQSFEEYETCTPEQLEILKQRIESKKIKDMHVVEPGLNSPLVEWVGRGVAVQTSDMSMSLPPCTCHVPSPTPVSSNFIFNFQDLMPVKQAMDAIHHELLYDTSIDFNRFKLVGQDSRQHLKEEPKKEFQQVRYDEIRKILKDHPSLLDIFQANL